MKAKLSNFFFTSNSYLLGSLVAFHLFFGDNGVTTIKDLHLLETSLYLATVASYRRKIILFFVVG